MARLIVVAVLCSVKPSLTLAHDWHFQNCPHVAYSHAPLNVNGGLSRQQQVEDEETNAGSAASSNDPELKKAPTQVLLSGPQAEAFEPFANTVTTFINGQYLVVESNGLPSHQMMVGIKAWQQQVPIPQPFSGDNAWRLPLHPTPADKPISVLKDPLSGAIALAINGVPIFCALNNRGEDTLLAGELDEFGGHCGRGDDYHYHAAPVHLEKEVGIGNPIGYALDGYPIIGFTEADGSTPTDLDKFNGHQDADGNYHYHASKTFPYVNGGLKGKVTMDWDQVKQPRDLRTRPSLQPLKGATITDFTQDGNDFDLEYEVDGKKGHVKYSLLKNERVEFTFLEPSGKSSTAIYQRGQVVQDGEKPIFIIVGLLLVGIFIAMVYVRQSGAANFDK